MIPYGGKELADGFRTVRKNTIQVAEDIPESKYDFVAAPDVRPVRQMLAHVAVVTRFWEETDGKGITTMQGFDFSKLMELAQSEENKLQTKAEIVQSLRANGERFVSWLETLTPEFLSQRVTEPDGQTKSRFERILGAKEHEMHHREQLMLIERQLGIVPHLTRQRLERMAQMKGAAKA